MLGLYVHIPFCARRCPYCDFAVHIGASAALQHDYLEALRQELESTLGADSRPLTSIFCGGGTPSSVGANALNELLRFIHEHTEVAPDAEISLEANPEDLDEGELATLRAGGWNRLSLGAQSLDDEVLQRLNRKHTAAQIESVVRAAQRAGWENLSLDLIYAVPGQTRDSWRDTLQRVADLQPQHVSCYALTIEAQTAFARRVERGRLVPVPDDAQAAFMQDAEVLLGERDFIRYEISNYARDGYECRHNLNYWRGGDYLAGGCGAHGHQNGRRWWNERDAQRYIESIRERGHARAGEETLSPRERLDEMVLLGLRLREGFRLNAISQRLQLDAESTLGKRLKHLRARGVLMQRGDHVQLAREAVPLADAVAVELLS